MKLMMKFYLCLHNFSERQNLIFLVPVGNCFRCYFRQISISLAFKKSKKDCKILKIILVPDFCPLKTEIARFSIGFRLKTYRFPWYLTLVSANHASSSPGLINYVVLDLPHVSNIKTRFFNDYSLCDNISILGSMCNHRK